MDNLTIECPKCNGEGSTALVEWNIPVRQPCYFCSTQGKITREVAQTYLRDCIASNLAVNKVTEQAKSPGFYEVAAESGISNEVWLRNCIWREESILIAELAKLKTDTIMVMGLTILPHLYNSMFEEVVGCSHDTSK